MDWAFNPHVANTIVMPGIFTWSPNSAMSGGHGWSGGPRESERHAWSTPRDSSGEKVWSGVLPPQPQRRRRRIGYEESEVCGTEWAIVRGVVAGARPTQPPMIFAPAAPCHTQAQTREVRQGVGFFSLAPSFSNEHGRNQVNTCAASGGCSCSSPASLYPARAPPPRAARAQSVAVGGGGARRKGKRQEGGIDMTITHILTAIVITIIPDTGIAHDADGSSVMTLRVVVGIAPVAVVLPSCYGEGIFSRDANLVHIPTVGNMPHQIRPGSVRVPKRMLVLVLNDGGIDKVRLVHAMILGILAPILLLLPPVVKSVTQVSPSGQITRSDPVSGVTITRGGRRQGRGVHRVSTSFPLAARSDPTPTPHVIVTVRSVVILIDGMSMRLVLAPRWPEEGSAPVTRPAAGPGCGTLACEAADL